MQNNQPLFHIRSTRSRNPNTIKPNIIVLRDKVHRCTVRQMRAYSERDGAFMDFLEQRLGRMTAVERVEASDTMIRVFVSNTAPLKASKLKRIKAYLYQIPVMTDKLNSWCKTLGGMLLSGDAESYQKTEEVDLASMLGGRSIVFVDPAGNVKAFTL